jgi:host factor-I protein
MSKTVLNLQDSFLNQVRKEGTEVKIVMLDGSSLGGYVKGFDNFTVILQSQGKQFLLYKHAISQVISGKNNRPQQNSTSNSSNKKKSAFNPIDLSRVKVEDQEAQDG